MVTKRTVIGIKERVESARDRLYALIQENREVLPGELSEVVGRDLNHALDDLDYAFTMAD